MKYFLLICVIFLSVIFPACNNATNEKRSPDLNDSTSYTGLTGDSARLVKSANLQVKVRDVEQG